MSFRMKSKLRFAQSFFTEIEIKEINQEISHFSISLMVTFFDLLRINKTF